MKGQGYIMDEQQIEQLKVKLGYNPDCDVDNQVFDMVYQCAEELRDSYGDCDSDIGNFLLPIHDMVNQVIAAITRPTMLHLINEAVKRS